MGLTNPLGHALVMVGKWVMIYEVSDDGLVVSCAKGRV